MLSRIRGTLEGVGENRAEIRQGDLCYEVLLPSYLERELASAGGETVELFVHHYLEGGPGAATMIPRLVGFVSAADRDFYHQLIKVPGLGAKSALKAMVIPPGEMARAIEGENKSALSALPGIGGRSADKIIATLKGKVSRFATAGAGKIPASGPSLDEAGEEALAVLLKLAYRRTEAEELIRRVRRQNPALAAAEEIISAVFREAGSGMMK